MTDARIGAALDAAEAAYDQLGLLAEDVEDEWTYVTELGAAWKTRFGEVRDARGTDALSGGVAAAIDRAVVEIEAITDPHRAIDWLSTFPQVVLVALGERP